jgi:hypothetical protein
VAVVWLTTAGHTMNFREMNAAKGWVAAEAYSLHSAFLLAIGLTLLAAPRLVGRFSFRQLMLLGLGLFVLGSAVNGFLISWPLSTFIAGRVLAGVGGGLIIFSAPHLLSPRWDETFAWGGILLPTFGPPGHRWRQLCLRLGQLGRRIPLRGVARPDLLHRRRCDVPERNSASALRCRSLANPVLPVARPRGDWLLVLPALGTLARMVERPRDADSLGGGDSGPDPVVLVAVADSRPPSAS